MWNHILALGKSSETSASETKTAVTAAKEMKGKKIADQLERSKQIKSVKTFVWNGKKKQEKQ